MGDDPRKGLVPVDPTLAGLLTAWWASGDRDAARVLADCLLTIL